MFLKPLSYPKKLWTLNEHQMGASTSGLQGKSERQHSGSKSRYLFFGDDFSLPFVLQIFKGHPLFTMITIQNKGKGLEVVASPADPRLQRYVSFNNGLEIWIHTISIFQQDQTSEEESWLRDHLMSFHYESTNWKMWWKLKNSQWNIQFV